MTLLIGFAAVNTGNNLLYLLVSALLGFMAVSGILGRENLQRLEVGIDLPDEVYDDLETLATVRLDNRRRLLPALLLRVTLLGEDATFHVVAREESATRGVTVTFRGRGRRPLPPVQICSIFPINFFVRSRTLAVERTVTVFPAPRPCPGAAAAEGRKTAGEMAITARGYEGDLSRIADYRGGEPLKMIHWKLSARHGQLKVKELSAAAGEPVVLDPEALPGADLEERLRCAAFLVNGCLRENRPVGLRLGKRLIPPSGGHAHKLRLLTELAVYGQD